MKKQKLRIAVWVLLVALGARLLFPELHDSLRQMLGNLVGLGVSSARLIETMGENLSEDGLPGAITTAFRAVYAGDLYPAGNLYGGK